MRAPGTRPGGCAAGSNPGLMTEGGPVLRGLPACLVLRCALRAGHVNVAATNTDKQSADCSQDED